MLEAGELPVAELLGEPIGLAEVGAALAAEPGVKHPVRM